jgi:flavin-dependent dehydrogenase
VTRAVPDYDVVVAGGGPAGATTAGLLAQAGRRVLLVERAAEPRFRIGESLMPATYWTFRRLGLLDAMRGSAFPVKHSVQFFDGAGRASAPFYFSEDDPHESSRTWQVLREDFDPMLRRRAGELGAQVLEGTSVQQVLFDGDRAVGARLAGGDGTRDVTARVVVDATGQSALLSRRLGLRVEDDSLRHVAFFTHYEGAERDEGIDEGATLVLHTAENRSWFWFIPLPNDRASVGVVGPVDELIRDRAADPQAVFEEELARCPALRPRVLDARQVMEMKVLRDFSYRSPQVAGDGWVLVGDAFGFIDPIYSTGVFLALKSGEMAADAIHEALGSGDLSGGSLGRFQAELAAGMDVLKQLVHAFYEPTFSFGAFLRVYPHRRQDIVNMLVGKVFDAPAGGLLRDLRAFLATSPHYSPGFLARS